jgi:1,4-alpha-glucan branching enzyme
MTEPKIASKKAKKVRFQLTTEPGNEVCVAGSFNNWDMKANPLKNNPQSGVYSTTLTLPAGRHEYKFVVNGKWCLDPNCPEAASNPYGSLNSVINV